MDKEASEALEWTGERLVPGCNRPLVYEHLHRYAVACALAEGRRVLDIACGEGYGASLLARPAATVIGVDRDETAIAHARAAYRKENLEFIAGTCAKIPCPDASVDLVVSFETIEHLDDHDGFLAEIRRVLAPSGVLVISSPNKAEYEAATGATNEYHRRELSHEEFRRLLERAFRHCLLGRQRLVAGSWIGADEPGGGVATGTFRGGFDGIEMEEGVYRGIYSIAVCSNEPLPRIVFGMFEDAHLSAEVWQLLDRTEDVAQWREQEGKKLRAKTREAEAARIALEQSQTELASSHKRLTQTQADLASSRERLEQLSQALSETRWDLLTLRGSMLGGNFATSASTQLLETQSRAEAAESQCETLRRMMSELQLALEATQTALESRTNELRLWQERVDHTLQSFPEKLILPFSSPHRKLRRLARHQSGG